MALDLALAERLFAALRERSAAQPGVTRQSYGPGEQAAHELVHAEAEALGLETERDAAGNLYATLPGRDRRRPRIVVGSHLDSVPHGGNYDGAAGVVAGLMVASALRRQGRELQQDLTVMAIRAEESTWFPVSYVGSRAALGLLPPEALEARRADTGRSLAQHMADAGFDPALVRAGRCMLQPDSLAAFIEVHIEQGPTLLGEGRALGLVTGIRGSFRYRHARCLGEYGHSGAVPRRYRRDAVAATCALVSALEALWRDLEAQGQDLTVTVGQLQTDSREHAFSKISGEVGFALDVRSLSEATLATVREHLLGFCRAIETERGVRFELGDESGSRPALLDEGLLARCEAAAEHCGVPALRMPSGAGHDAAVFANAGVPSSMLFVRNANGSHNPDEAMEIEDFAAACRVLAELLEGWSGAS